MTIPANIQLARADSKADRTLRAALRNAERGWPIFPLWPHHGDKCGCGDPVSSRGPSVARMARPCRR